MKRLECNQEYFRNMDSPDKWWILFILLTDGYIFNNSVGLEMIDLDVIEKFKLLLSSESNIRIVRDKRPTRKIRYAITMSSKCIVRDLALLNMISTKTVICELPHIPVEFERDAVRGAFDGDGCICITDKTVKAEYAGTESMVNGIANILRDNNITCNTQKRSVNNFIYELQINKAHMVKFYHYLYDGTSESIRMNRKYDKFKAYVESLP